MNWTRRALVATTAVAVSVALLLAPAEGARPTGAPDPGELQERLDAVVDAGAVGALAEVRTPRGLWRGTSGEAELGTRRQVSPEGRFRAGSITKTFVATVVLQLVHKGRLELDDPVEAWLPGVVPDGERISVRHLLNHTSGLYDYVRTVPMPPSQEFLDNRWRTWTPAEQMERALAHPPTFRPPGSAFAYSNTNYLLLGEIIERATGRAYATEVVDRIVEPLRLTGTSMPGSSPTLPTPHLRGYVPALQAGELQLLDYTEMNPSVLGAGGELISTARDLNRFLDALLGGRLLPATLLEEMRTAAVPGRKYGLGLAWRDTSCGTRVYGNDGDALAFQAWAFSTLDGRVQASLALTPDFTGNVDEAVGEVLDAAFCG